MQQVFSKHCNKYVGKREDWGRRANKVCTKHTGCMYPPSERQDPKSYRRQQKQKQRLLLLTTTATKTAQSSRPLNICVINGSDSNSTKSQQYEYWILWIFQNNIKSRQYDYAL